MLSTKTSPSCRIPANARIPTDRAERRVRFTALVCSRRVNQEHLELRARQVLQYVIPEPGGNEGPVTTRDVDLSLIFGGFFAMITSHTLYISAALTERDTAVPKPAAQSAGLAFIEALAPACTLPRRVARFRSPGCGRIAPRDAQRQPYAIKCAFGPWKA